MQSRKLFAEVHVSLRTFTPATTVTVTVSLLLPLGAKTNVPMVRVAPSVQSVVVVNGIASAPLALPL